MKLKDLFKQWWRRVMAFIQPKEAVSPASSSPAFGDEQVKALVMGLAQTDARELSCDEVFALLDVFSERVQRGEDAATMMPLVEHHLAMCPDCREEYEALLKSMEATAAGD